MLKTTVIVLMGLAMFASMVIGCSSDSDINENDNNNDVTLGEPKSLIDYVPKQASMVGYIDLTSIPVDVTTRNIGIEIKEAVFFGDFSEIDDLSDDSAIESIPAIVKQFASFGIIATGNFDEDQFARKTEDQSLSIANFKDSKLYANETDKVAITFMENGVLVLGAVQSVKDVISLKDSDNSSVPNGVLGVYKNLGEATFKMTIAMLDETAILGLKGNKESQSITITAEQACFSDEVTAQEVHDTITALASIFDIEEPRASLEGSCIDISLDLPVAKIQKMLNSIASGFTSVQTENGSDDNWGELWGEDCEDWEDDWEEGWDDGWGDIEQ